MRKGPLVFLILLAALAIWMLFGGGNPNLRDHSSKSTEAATPDAGPVLEK
jgi:hypothetical protein